MSKNNESITQQPPKNLAPLEQQSVLQLKGKWAMIITAAGAVSTQISPLLHWGTVFIDWLQRLDFLNSKFIGVLRWLFSPKGAQVLFALFLAAFFVAVYRTVHSKGSAAQSFSEQASEDVSPLKAEQVEQLNKRITELEDKNKGLESRWNTHVFGNKRVLAVADTQKQSIDHYVTLKKITTVERNLDRPVPNIIFELEVHNASIFDISISETVEGSIFFGEQHLAERIIVRQHGENIPPLRSGTLILEQRLSVPEANLIANPQKEDANFSFSRLGVFITGGTDYRGVARKALKIPQDFEVDAPTVSQLNAEVSSLRAETTALRESHTKLEELKKAQQFVESQLWQRVKITRALGETMGYGQAVKASCESSNMTFPKHEIDEWASRLWTVLQWCFEENDIEKFYSGIDPRCPGYERGVPRLIKVPDSNEERHLWLFYHLKRLSELITEQQHATTIVRKEEGQQPSSQSVGSMPNP